jgi:hypothetical protein
MANKCSRDRAIESLIIEHLVYKGPPRSGDNASTA